MPQEALLELTTDIVTAHVGNHTISLTELPQLIQSVYGSLSRLGQIEKPEKKAAIPAVPVRSSLKSDVLTCLECGATQKSMKRHLHVQHDLTPDAYRARWKLPSDYPMIAPDYAARRKHIAIEIGLGRKRVEQQMPAPELVCETLDSQVQPTESSKPEKKVRRKLGISVR